MSWISKGLEHPRGWTKVPNIVDSTEGAGASRGMPKEVDFHRRCKKLNDRWWWVSILKNASTTMERMTTESPPDADAKFIAIIRNPFDRLVSAWENNGDSFPADNFDQFIEHCVGTPDGVINGHAQSQVSFLEPWPDKFILFDYLEEDFAKLGMTIRHHLNKSRERRPTMEYFQLVHIPDVIERYEDDFELYEDLLIERNHGGRV